MKREPIIERTDMLLSDIWRASTCSGLKGALGAMVVMNEIRGA